MRAIEDMSPRELEIAQLQAAIALAEDGMDRMKTALDQMREKQFARRAELKRQLAALNRHRQPTVLTGHEIPEPSHR